MPEVLNWVWQGSIVALAAGGLLRTLGRLRAVHRSRLCWGALAMVFALPFVPVLLTGSPSVSLDTDPSGMSLQIPSAWWNSSVTVIGLAGMWCIAFGARAGSALCALSRARRHARPFQPEMESRLDHWKTVRESGRRTRLVLSSEVRAAAVLGWGSPVIAVAPALLENLDRTELDRIIVHEWAHVQRRDDVVNVAQLAIRAAAGWHPAIWWLERQLRIEREAACDEIAIAVTGSAKAYAASLTTAAGVAGEARAQRRPGTLGALSSAGLRHRILRILRHQRLVPPTWSMGAATGALVVIGAVATSVVGARVFTDPVTVGSLDTTFTGIASPIVARPSPTVSPKNVPPAKSRVESRGSRVAPEASRAADAERGDPVVEPWTPAPIVLGGLPSSQMREPSPVAFPERTAPLLPDLTYIAATVEPGPLNAPWTVATDAGLAVGRGSQNAALSTATFFKRFGKKVAASF